MRGQSIAYVGGGDRTVPFHVQYSEPTKRPKGLDWASLAPKATTEEEIHQAKPTCSLCLQHVDTVSRFTSLCPACETELDPHHNQPTTATPKENTMNDFNPPEDFDAPVELPEYAIELGQLLADTEGHPDPLVRAIRKIVTQSAIALQQASAPHTSGSDATATAQPSQATDESTSTPGPEDPKTGRAPSSSVLLMQKHGITAAEVREWAARSDIEVAARGSISVDVIQHYLEHRVAA